MTWWGYILAGLVWVAAVVAMFVVSMNAATNAVAADLASDFSATQVATAAVSAVIFAGPGLYLILSGVRKKRALP
jgi:threonine/homoserine/homoserine lactone efflux protein